MGKELELLQKMELTAENRQKLETLITEAKKTGKVSSKHLVETLDDVDATQAQTEQFYDILEQAGIEIDVSDVLDLIGSADMDNPTLSEMQAIEDEGLPEDLETPEALPEDVETAKLDDPVRMYLKEIGRIKLLSPEEEQEVARAMAEGDEKTGVQIVLRDEDNEYYTPTSLDSRGYQYVKETAQAVFPYAAVAPFILPAGTAARRFTALSDAVIRFVPIDIDDQQYASVHGENENISIDKLPIAVDFYKQLLRNYA